MTELINFKLIHPLFKRKNRVVAEQIHFVNNNNLFI